MVYDLPPKKQLIAVGSLVAVNIVLLAVLVPLGIIWLYWILPPSTDGGISNRPMEQAWTLDTDTSDCIKYNKSRPVQLSAPAEHI